MSLRRSDPGAGGEAALRVLVTGGNGSVGRDLVPALLDRGNEVVVLDRELSALRALGGRRHLDLIRGAIEDRSTAAAALRGADAVVHLAWSFADDVKTLLERDLLGEQLLLELSRAGNVRRFLYASSAVVYGKPARSLIDEGHPLRPLQARKPAYGLAK
ncbi:MAG: NAD-dependent epimerase/dehydratase family protein [Myxococcales bacterium]